MSQYNDFKGSKYNSDLSTTEIAKLIREEIKALRKAGKLPTGKYSVRSQYFSGGSSIDVRVRDLDMLIWNPDALITQEITYPNQPWNWRGNVTEPQYNKWAQDVLDTLNGLMDAYNHDRSDIMTDYFDVNFYGHAEFDWEWAGEQRKQAVEALKMEV